jgi:2-oxoglutarate-dependent dioxygenase
MSLAAGTQIVTPMRLTVAELLFYQNEGYLPLPGFIHQDAIEAIREEIYEVLDANGVSRQSLSSASSAADKLRQCNQYLKASKLDELINGQPTLDVASQLVGGPAHRYLPFTAVKAAGGGGQFHFHQDNNYTNHDPALGSINIWVALVDMTPENGCLMIVPRSHDGIHESRNSDDGDSHQQIDVPEKDRLPIRMRAGDAVAFTRWTVHGSGQNVTDEPRVAYALQYHREDVKFLDKDSGDWKLLVEQPRFSVPPLENLG